MIDSQAKRMFDVFMIKKMIMILINVNNVKEKIIFLKNLNIK